MDMGQHSADDPTAATPLLMAAMGELVVERSGVLNLGVEGMMIMGAVTGFSLALVTGNPWIGMLAGIAGRRAVFASCSAFLVLSVATIRWQPACR